MTAPATRHARSAATPSPSIGLSRGPPSLATASSLLIDQGSPSRVMKDDPDYQDDPGDFRTRVVWIGGDKDIAYSSINPPPPPDVPDCLAQAVDYLRNEGMQQMTQGFITRMAIAHAHFEAVHPFRAGNGRVGRLLLPLMMAAEKRVPLYLSPYIESKKGTYYASLKNAQQRLDWEPIITFMADAVTATVEELIRTRQALSELSERWRGRRKFRKGFCGSSGAGRASQLSGRDGETAPRTSRHLYRPDQPGHRAAGRGGHPTGADRLRAQPRTPPRRRLPSSTARSAKSRFSQTSVPRSVLTRSRSAPRGHRANSGRWLRLRIEEALRLLHRNKSVLLCRYWRMKNLELANLELWAGKLCRES